MSIPILYDDTQRHIYSGTQYHIPQNIKVLRVILGEINIYFYKLKGAVYNIA